MKLSKNLIQIIVPFVAFVCVVSFAFAAHAQTTTGIGNTSASSSGTMNGSVLGASDTNLPDTGAGGNAAVVWAIVLAIVTLATGAVAGREIQV